ncbi:unnamed protein product [Mytilus coruscus]|uniref:Uncharacterized protein n=1 Tax=Mytilus coruscus TaxID=42192 RepID=A0A6J8BT66_MYTCO|nr:unnamed protein product [Mytilus coruscus]
MVNGRNMTVSCKAYVWPTAYPFITWKLNNSIINPTDSTRWMTEYLPTNNSERWQFRLTVMNMKTSDSDEIIIRTENAHTSQLVIYGIQNSAQYACSGINNYGEGGRLISHITVTDPDNVYQYCPSIVDQFGSDWGITIENAIAINQCPGDRTGTTSRFCNGNGKWEEPNYSTCVSKDLLILDLQSDFLRNGVEVKDVNSILLDLNTITKPDIRRDLTSGELEISSNILGNIAYYAKERVNSLSVDQLEHSYAKHSGGNQKAKLDGKIKKFAVLRKEVIHSDELSDSLEQFKYGNVILTVRSRELLECLQKCTESKEVVERKLQSLEKKLESDGKQLQKKLNCKSQRKNSPTLKIVIGLQPTNVIFHDSLGSSVNLELGTNNKDMEKMKEVLFIMDRFKINDQAYHEVATISDTLPELHSIINIRDNMNNNLEIYRTPGNTTGAYVSLRTELRKMMEQRSNIPENIKIKISGDGTKNFKGITRIAKAVTVYTKAYTYVNDSVFQRTVQKDQLVVQVGKVSQEDITFPRNRQVLPDWIAESTNQVTLNKENFKGQQPVGYSTTYYRNISNLFHQYYISEGVVTTMNGSYDVNSVVIDFSIEPTPTKLQLPLVVKFDHLRSNYSYPVCAFWDFDTLNTPNGAWSLTGSKLFTTSQGVTICQYDHTTNFALLMSPEKAPSLHSRVLSKISAAGCGISIAFLVVTVIIHTILWRHLTRDTRGKKLKRDKEILLVNLCVALTISYILFLVGITLTNNKKVCSAMAALLHYIFLVDFAFMLAEGIEIAISIRLVFLTSSRTKWLIPACWVSPAVIVGISMGATKLDGYGNSQYCWLSIESKLIWTFVGPVLTVILYLFAVFNSLQGFFIFLFHTVLNQQVRDGIQKMRGMKADKSSTYSQKDATRESSVPSIEFNDILKTKTQATAPVNGISNSKYSHQNNTERDNEIASVNSTTPKDVPGPIKNDNTKETKVRNKSRLDKDDQKPKQSDDRRDVVFQRSHTLPSGKQNRDAGYINQRVQRRSPS